MDIDVRKIAKLSYLDIDESEVANYQAKMQSIIEMVDSLPDQTNFDDTPKAEDAMELRDDSVQSSVPREKLLAGAPQMEAGCVVVPKTVDSGE